MVLRQHRVEAELCERGGFVFLGGAPRTMRLAHGAGYALRDIRLACADGAGVARKDIRLAYVDCVGLCSHRHKARICHHMQTCKQFVCVEKASGAMRVVVRVEGEPFHSLLMRPSICSCTHSFAHAPIHAPIHLLEGSSSILCAQGSPASCPR